jgi:hypothetical protein
MLQLAADASSQLVVVHQPCPPARTPLPAVTLDLCPHCAPPPLRPHLLACGGDALRPAAAWTASSAFHPRHIAQ